MWKIFSNWRYLLGTFIGFALFISSLIWFYYCYPAWRLEKIIPFPAYLPIFYPNDIAELRGGAFIENNRLAVWGQSEVFIFNLLDNTTNKLKQEHQFFVDACGTRFSPSPSRCLFLTTDLVATQGGATLWRLPDGEKLFKLPDAGCLNHAVFTSDENYLITTDLDRRVKLWDIQQKKLIRELGVFQEYICSLDISKDGEHIVASSENGTIKIWSMDPKYPKPNIINVKQPIWSVCFLSNDTLAIATRNGAVEIWDTHYEHRIWVWQGPWQTTFDLKRLTDDAILATDCDAGAFILYQDRAERSIKLDARSDSATIFDNNRRIALHARTTKIPYKAEYKTILCDAISGQKLQEFDGHLFCVEKEGKQIITNEYTKLYLWKKERDEGWRGILSLPAFWATILSGILFLYASIKRLKNFFPWYLVLELRKRSV